MTAVATMVRSEPPPARAIELVLAHAHLRLGALALARVELETMATLGILDGSGLGRPGRGPLADRRPGRGGGGGRGRHAGRCRRPDRADDRCRGGLLPRPSERGAPARPAGDGHGRWLDRCDLRGDASRRGLATRCRRAATDRADPVRPRAGGSGPGRGRRLRGGIPGVVRGADPARSDGSGDARVLGRRRIGRSQPRSVSPSRARRSSSVGPRWWRARQTRPRLHLGLALRLAPALAPAVLEATAGARGPAVAMVRGDAYRLAGHEAEARNAYADAARGGPPERRKRARIKPSKPAAADDADMLEMDPLEALDEGAERRGRHSGRVADSDPIAADNDATAADSQRRPPIATRRGRRHVGTRGRRSRRGDARAAIRSGGGSRRRRAAPRIRPER